MERWLRTPAARCPTGWCAATLIAMVHSRGAGVGQHPVRVGGDVMMIIDAQVHAYERNHPGRRWVGTLHGPAEVTGDDMVAAMDAVGVDGAVLVSPFTLYRYDASYALEVYAKHPGRFGLIKPFDPRSEAVAEEIAEWARTPGVAGARLMLTSRSHTADDPGLNRILAAGAKAGIPVNVLCWGKLALLRDLARRNPNTQVVVDHVALIQPFAPPV